MWAKSDTFKATHLLFELRTPLASVLFLLIRTNKNIASNLLTANHNIHSFHKFRLQGSCSASTCSFEAIGKGEYQSWGTWGTQSDRFLDNGHLKESIIKLIQYSKSRSYLIFCTYMRCAIGLGQKWSGASNNLERKQNIHHHVKCIHEICQHIYRVDWSGSCGEQPESQLANFHASVPSISTTGIWSYICRLNLLSFVHLRQFQIRVQNEKKCFRSY